MEYVAGPNLPDLLREGPLPARRAAAYLETIAQAVHYAHQNGILHRDLKPSNILIDERDQPRITDFGLAKRFSSSSDLTLTGQVLGSPNYLPPEQAAGRRDRIGPRSDVYSLGAILYHLLTGRPPFLAERLEDTVLQVLREDPVPLRLLNPGSPRDLETISLKCMEKEPSRRYVTAQALADDLRRFLEGKPVLAHRVGPIGKALRWAKRKPALAAASALAMLFFFAVVALLTYFTIDTRYRLAESHLLRGQLLCEQGEIDRGLNWMAHAFAEAPVGSDRLRQVIRMNLGGWGQLWNPPQMTLDCDGGWVNTIEYSPDGQWLATGSSVGARLWSVKTGKPIGPLFAEEEIGTIVFNGDGNRLLTVRHEYAKPRLWSLEDGGPEEIPVLMEREARMVVAASGGKLFLVEYPAPAPATSLSSSWAGGRHIGKFFSMDSGKEIGKPIILPDLLTAADFSSDSKIVMIGMADGAAGLFSTDTGEMLAGPLKHEGPIQDVAISPDGTLALTASGDKGAQLWSVKAGTPHGPRLQHLDRLLDIEFSPDGKQVVTGSRDRTARVWSTESSQLLLTLEHTGAVDIVKFSPDGKLILCACLNYTTWLWSSETGEQVGRTVKHKNEINRMQFSNDSRFFVTASMDLTAKLWSTQPMEIPCHRFKHPRRRVRCAVFSPDGKKVLTASLTVARLWSTESGGELGITVQHETMIWTVAFSPDGKRCASGSRDGIVKIWSADTGEAWGQPLQHPTEVRSVVFSPDGKLLATACFDGFARLWSVATGELVGQPLQHDDRVEDVAFSPDGSTLITCSNDKTAKLWSIKDHGLLAPPLRHQAGVLAVAVSPDGELVATGGRDNTARLWSMPSGIPVLTPLQHANDVGDLVFSPDGQLLLTYSEKFARLWSVKTGLQVAPPFTNGGTVASTDFSPDGRSVLTASLTVLEATMYDLPSPLEGDEERIRLWTEAQTGLEMSSEGVLGRLEASAWRERRERLARLETGSAAP
jgi:WD40 repeat protein